MPRRSVVTGQVARYPIRTRQTEAWRSSLCVAAQETAIALEAATGDKFVFDVYEPITVVEFRVAITVLINYDTLSAAAVVALDHRVTYGSDTGRVALGSVTIPDAAPAGEQIYVDLTPTNIERGDQLVVEVTTQGAGGGSIAGDWLPVILFQSTDFEDITLKASDSGLTATA